MVLKLGQNFTVKISLRLRISLLYLIKAEKVIDRSVKITFEGGIKVVLLEFTILLIIPLNYFYAIILQH